MARLPIIPTNSCAVVLCNCEPHKARLDIICKYLFYSYFVHFCTYLAILYHAKKTFFYHFKNNPLSILTFMIYFNALNVKFIFAKNLEIICKYGNFIK